VSLQIIRGVPATTAKQKGYMADDPNKNDDKNTDKGGDKGETIPKASYDVVAEKLRKEKEAREQAEAKLQEIEKAKQAEEEEKAKKNGEFEKLLEDQKAETEKLRGQLKESAKSQAIAKVASELGSRDPELVKQIIAGKIEVSEDGTVDEAKVKELVESVKTEKPYLFGEVEKPSIGNEGGAPNGGQQDKPTFKRSQLSDTKFYAENRDAILEAQGAGRIEDDVSPQKK
jgi:ribosomal protein L20A (L18A)